MKRRGRDLIWLLLLVCLIALVIRRFSVSHDLDGQTYSAQIWGYAFTELEFKNGTFKLSRHTCMTDNEWRGRYRVVGDALELSERVLPDNHFKMRRSTGRIYLDSSGNDYDRTLKLTADTNRELHPPRWTGSPLRLQGVHPGMVVKSLGPGFRSAGKFENREIFVSGVNVAASVKGGKVMAVGGPQLSDQEGTVLLDTGEDQQWIEQCLGQSGTRQEGMVTFPCGLSAGGGDRFLSGYFLGEVKEVDALRMAVLRVSGIDPAFGH
ncbi:MAG: hypothetical protein J0I12_34940 [Candidatus Eremiobacteraeota bacterium]|nr:hypothetical protein [Candidatus Eremiobacteraeota bacterium]